MPTEKVDEFLLGRDLFDELIEVCFRGHIARADPMKIISASGLGWPTGQGLRYDGSCFFRGVGFGSVLEDLHTAACDVDSGLVDH